MSDKINDPLIVVTDWPLNPGCDAGTSIAMDQGVPASHEPTDHDYRVDLLAAGGGPWQNGQLTLYLQAKDDRTFQVIDIRPHVVAQTSTPPAWVYQPHGGCGDSYFRTFAVDFDDPVPHAADLGVVGEEEAMTSVTPRSEPLGKSFTVSSADPAELALTVSRCKAGSTSFTVEIDYLDHGTRRTVEVGTKEEPFVIYSGDTVTMAPVDGLGTSKLGRTEPFDFEKCREF